jgi:beta-glucanase (GH16 family)
MPVGWKQFFKMTTGDFKSYYDRAQSWGDLLPYRITIDTKEYYGAGIIASPGEGQVIGGFSPKIAHLPGATTRITVKFIFYADANTPTSCTASILIVFYTNGDTAKDEQGYDAHGVEVSLTNVPGTNVADFHEFRVEQSGNKITWYGDGQKIGEATLSGNLQSFAFYVRSTRYYVVSESESTVTQAVEPDAHGIVIYEVTGEYYDQLEDMFNMITQVMFIMMFAMVGITLITTLFRAFGGRRRRVEYVVGYGGE